MKKRFFLLVGVFVVCVILSFGVISGSFGGVAKQETNVSCGDTIYNDTVLTEDLLNCYGDGLIIGADDITIDCDGHMIDSFGFGHGIYLISRNNVTIKNCIVQDFQIGIRLESSSNNNVINNIANNSFIGIYLRFSSNNNINGNIANYNRLGMVLASNSYSNNITGNTLNNNIVNGIDLDTSSDNSLTDNIANDNSVCGIYLRSTSNNVFTNNTAKNNQYGIYLHTSSDNSLNGNIIENDQYGAYLLSESHYNTFWNNKFASNSVSAYEEADSNNNNWNYSDMGNYWDDFENPGYPDNYTVSGPGNGVDYQPIWTYICGDVNADKEINVGDVVFLINYLFMDGDPPLCEPITACGDVNLDGQVNIADAVYLINYLFIDGSEPCNPKPKMTPITEPMPETYEEAMKLLEKSKIKSLKMRK